MKSSALERSQTVSWDPELVSWARGVDPPSVIVFSAAKTVETVPDDCNEWCAAATHHRLAILVRSTAHFMRSFFVGTEKDYPLVNSGSCEV